MSPSQPIRPTIRRELSLDVPHRRRRPSSLLRLAAVTTLLWGLAPGSAVAQVPYQQELLRGFSSFDVGHNSHPDFVDLDGDGDFDAVTGELYGSVQFFENTGTAATPAFAARHGAANPFAAVNVEFLSSPALADLDGDGDPDVVVGDLGGILRFFENTGTATTVAFVERTGAANPFDALDVGDRSAPRLADVDGDGDLDAIVGERYGSLRFFANTGTSTVPTFVEQTGAANPFNDINVGFNNIPELADLDGDGDLDAVVGRHLGDLRFFANTGTTSTPALVELTGAANPLLGINVGIHSAPDLADLDGDGDLDLVVGEGGGSLRTFKNTGTAALPAFANVTGTANPLFGIDVGTLSTPELVDLDGDGDFDAIVGENRGSLKFFANTGSPAKPAFVERTGAASPFQSIDVGDRSNPELADLDGDGDLDLVVGEILGLLQFFENTGSSTTPAFAEQTGAANPFDGLNTDYYSSPMLADLDYDGDLDAIVGNAAGYLRLLENTGSSTAPAFVEQTGAANPFDGIDVGEYSSPELVDTDGDGDLDAVVGERFLTLRFFENTGSSAAPAFVERTGAANPWLNVHVGLRSSPSLADLDNDGDLDTLVGEVDGHLVFFRSLAANIFADGFESGNTSAWSSTVSP